MPLDDYRKNFGAFATWMSASPYGNRGEWRSQLDRQRRRREAQDRREQLEAFRRMFYCTPAPPNGKVQGHSYGRIVVDDVEVYCGEDADFLRSIGIDPEGV